MSNIENFTLDNSCEKSYNKILSPEVVADLKNILQEKLTGDSGTEVAELITLKINSLKQKHPEDWASYQTIYLLTREPVPNTVARGDFEGEDSVISFLHGL